MWPVRANGNKANDINFRMHQDYCSLGTFMENMGSIGKGNGD